MKYLKALSIAVSIGEVSATDADILQELYFTLDSNPYHEAMIGLCNDNNLKNEHLLVIEIKEGEQAAK